MNILRNLLFSFSGKIGRADYIYGIVYSLLIFFVSIDVFVHPPTITLIGWGLDIVQVVIYIVSSLGLWVFFWSFFAVTIKRARALDCEIRWVPFCLILPPLLMIGLMKDTEKYEYHGGLSLVDQVFFHLLLFIIALALFALYKIDIYLQFFFVLLLLLWSVSAYLFWSDRLPYRYLPKNKYTWLDMWIDLGFVLMIVFFVRLYILSPFQIIGPSMESTFQGGVISYTQEGQKYSDGEFILVDKMTYRTTSPQRGDVVVFTPGIGPEKRYLIKRVIGVPGDTIKIESWHVFLKVWGSFRQLDESLYLGEKYGHTCLTPGSICAPGETATYVVPRDWYFLMGDNRPQSLDSRKCFSNNGCVAPFHEAQYVALSRIQWRVAYSLGHFDFLSQILPFPKLGTLKQIVPFRGLDIHNSHIYQELSQ